MRSRTFRGPGTDAARAFATILRRRRGHSGLAGLVALEVPSEQNPPSEEVIRRALRVRNVRPILVPHDCVDGFGAAFWARPEAYLDPQVQAGMSWLALLAPEARQRGSERLASDLASGAWDRRHGYLRRLSSYDGGYRLAIAD